MLWFALGRWSYAAGSTFTRRRVYIKGRWTPFVKTNFRYCNVMLPEELERLTSPFPPQYGPSEIRNRKLPAYLPSED